MKISQIFLALCAVALAGCASNNEAANTPTAPETVGDPITMTTPPPEVVGNSAEVAGNSAEVASNSAEVATNSTAVERPASYRVRGQIVEVMPAKAGQSASVMVKHEDIPGFMDAMQMRVPLAKANDATTLKPGNKISFDMKRGNTEISNITQLPPSTQLKLAK